MTQIGNSPVFDRGMGYAGTDGDVGCRRLNADEFIDASNVYQQFRLNQSQVEHRTERLAAGENQGVRRLSQERNCLVDAFRLFVIEVDWLHVVTLPSDESLAAATASTIRRGVTGSTDSSTPIARSASLIALVIAAGGAIQPPSPMPLTPKRV